MTQQQKEFIEDNINIIESHQFKELYNNLQKEYIKSGYLRDNRLNIPGEDFVSGIYKILRSVDIDILESLEVIPYAYFLKDSSLTYFEVSKNIHTLERLCFAQCTNLKRIYIPATVTKIQDRAFFQCENLEIIDVDDLSTFVEANDSYSNIFMSAPIVHVNGTDVGEIFVTESTHKKLKLSTGKYTKVSFDLEDIRSNCCYNCVWLKEVNFSKQLSRINAEAFMGCSSLSNITFDGTLEEWNNVSISPSAFTRVPARTITCIDGVTKLRH